MIKKETLNEKSGSSKILFPTLYSKLLVVLMFLPLLSLKGGDLPPTKEQLMRMEISALRQEIKQLEAKERVLDDQKVYRDSINLSKIKNER